MAIYRFSAQMISRSAGRSSVAASAYRSGSELIDQRTGTVHDYRRKGGVVHSEIIAPDAAPQWATERARLWNEVETTEKRKDAQLARDVELALPRELTTVQQVELVREFVQEQFVNDGMVADVAIHDPLASDGQRQPHAHVMLTTRQIGPDGFGPKARQWNDKEKLEAWRSQWAVHVNRALERAGVDLQVDHRRLDVQRIEAERLAKVAHLSGDSEKARAAERRAQDLDREPQPKLGKTALAMERRGEKSDRGDLWRAAMARNANRADLWKMIRAWGNQIRDQVRDPIMQKLEAVKHQAAAAKQDLAARLRQANLTRLQESLDQRRQAEQAPEKNHTPSKGRDWGPSR